MTTVSGVGGSSSSELIQMLQELARQRAETAGTTSTQSSETSTANRPMFDESFDDALVSSGLDSSKLSEVKDAIQSAVSDALKNSDSSTDPREAVSKAVDTTLQQYGVDTAALKEKMESMRPAGPPSGGGPGGMGGPGGPGGMGGPGGGQDPSERISDALTAAGVDSSKIDEIESSIQDAISSAKSTDGTDDRETVKTAVHSVLDKYGVDTDAFDKQMESGMQAPPPPDQSSSGTSSSGGWSQDTNLLRPHEHIRVVDGFIPVAHGIPPDGRRDRLTRGAVEQPASAEHGRRTLRSGVRHLSFGQRLQANRTPRTAASPSLPPSPIASCRAYPPTPLCPV